MIVLTFTCMRCGEVWSEDDPTDLEMPDGWRFDTDEDELLCLDCASEADRETEEEDD